MSSIDACIETENRLRYGVFGGDGKNVLQLHRDYSCKSLWIY